MPQSPPVTNLFLPLSTKIPLPSPPASCGGMPVWKPICYIPTSPLYQLYPKVSLRNSLNLSLIKLTFPQLWEPLTSKYPTSIPQTHLFSAILYVLSITALSTCIPYKLSPSPAQKKTLWGLHTQLQQGFPVMYFKLKFWISATLPCPCFSVWSIKVYLRLLKQIFRRYLGPSPSLEFPPFFCKANLLDTNYTLKICSREANIDINLETWWAAQFPHTMSVLLAKKSQGLDCRPWAILVHSTVIVRISNLWGINLLQWKTTFLYHHKFLRAISCT